jgi:NADH dehydrogenase
MADRETHVVTGAFGYSGQYIARRLLDHGHRVINLTNSPLRPDPFEDKVSILPFNFDSPEPLAESLQGVKVLYNTYWVRFNHRLFKHADAMQNTLTLFEAARKAGVERIVHVSITNPSEGSDLEYFQGKAVLEKALKESGLSYAILRPAVLFGKEDILINNIAWALRKLPVFGVFGDGKYRIQPIYVDDIAALAVEQGASRENCTINAIGPETFTYRELVQTVARLIGTRRLIISVPPIVGYWVAAMLGRIVGDVIITHDEIKGLMSDLLYVDEPAPGTTKLTEWTAAHADTLGKNYASELARRKDRTLDYGAK